MTSGLGRMNPCRLLPACRFLCSQFPRNRSADRQGQLVLISVHGRTKTSARTRAGNSPSPTGMSKAGVHRTESPDVGTPRMHGTRRLRRRLASSLAQRAGRRRIPRHGSSPLRSMYVAACVRCGGALTACIVHWHRDELGRRAATSGDGLESGGRGDGGTVQCTYTQRARRHARFQNALVGRTYAC
ncbi:hypothetical protein K466DRAFT_387888 [Polyporus arcularius HHB13444]|uniref:Uncharacterized protein n=1 Tax=Polyporus arcularius HHB13444 TaxID=1314778 RepID=A0A5C3NU05_9APHY|nr:hypothetical protein K466DRAFT_387888 [Polyporus arcularius HHB13444]